MEPNEEGVTTESATVLSYSDFHEMATIALDSGGPPLLLPLSLLGNREPKRQDRIRVQHRERSLLSAEYEERVPGECQARYETCTRLPVVFEFFPEDESPRTRILGMGTGRYCEACRKMEVEHYRQVRNKALCDAEEAKKAMRRLGENV